MRQMIIGFSILQMQKKKELKQFLPMSLKEKIIGVLRIYTSEPREFSDAEKEFISGLAEIGSIGIENASMYTILKTDHEKLIHDVHKWFDYGEANRP